MNNEGETDKCDNSENNILERPAKTTTARTVHNQLGEADKGASSTR